MLFFGGRHSGVMVSVLNSRLSGPGPSPGGGHCVVFLDNAPISTQVYKWVPPNLCYRNLLSSGLMGLLACMQTKPAYLNFYDSSGAEGESIMRT